MRCPTSRAGSQEATVAEARGSRATAAATTSRTWEFAVQWNAGSELAGYADDDQLVDRLVEVARLNRSRRVLFVLDEVNYWQTGEARAVVGIPDRADALAYLRHEYPSRRVRYWNRNVSDWVELHLTHPSPSPSSRSAPLPYRWRGARHAQGSAGDQFGRGSTTALSRRWVPSTSRARVLTASR
jgi:hypothetical protein